MSQPISRWRVSLATGKVALFVLGATLTVALVTLSSRSAQAGPIPMSCAYVTGGQAFYTANEGMTSLGQQELIRWPCCTDEVHLRVNLSDGTTKDVTELIEVQNPNISYASGGSGCIFDETYCPSKDDINHEFPIYVFYKDPCTGQTWTFTVHVTVE